MAGFIKLLERLVRGGTCIAFAVMIVAVVVQVVARTFMAQPPIWTEETSRVALLYIMGLGVGASFLTGDLVNVDLVLMVREIPQRLQGGELFQVFEVLNLCLLQLVVEAVHRRERVEQSVRPRSKAVRFIGAEQAGGCVSSRFHGGGVIGGGHGRS